MIVVYGYNAASHSLGVALHSGSDIFWMDIYLQYTVQYIWNSIQFQEQHQEQHMQQGIMIVWMLEMVVLSVLVSAFSRVPRFGSFSNGEVFIWWKLEVHHKEVQFQWLDSCPLAHGRHTKASWEDMGTGGIHEPYISPWGARYCGCKIQQETK